jgi:hypothetical protein
MVGATEDDLLVMSASDRDRIPGTPNIKHRIIQDLENRRLETFRSVLDARNNLVEETRRKKQKTITVPVETTEQIDTDRYRKFKIRQIATLLVGQKLHKDAADAEDIVQKRLEEKRHHQQQLLASKQIAETQRIEQKLKRLTDQQNDCRDHDRTELEKSREKQRQKEARSIEKLEAEIATIPKSKVKLLKQKSEELEQLRTSSALRENEFLEAMSNLRNLELKALEKVDDEANQQRRQKLSLLFTEIKREKEKQDQARLEQIVLQKKARVEANLHALEADKQQKTEGIRKSLKQKSQAALAAALVIEEQRKASFEKVLAKQKEAEQRAESVKGAKLVAIQEKAGGEWLRQKVGAGNAKRHRILKEFEVMAKLEKTMERLQELEEIEKEKERIQIKTLRARELKMLKEKDEWERFQTVIRNNPDADVKKLAEEFHVSLDAVLEVQKSLMGSHT